MQRDQQMMRNALEPIGRAADGLRHVTLIQGAKAYSLQVGHAPLPAKERAPRATHENTYFLQKDLLRALAERAGFAWTILRPQVEFGESFGSPMNLVPAMGRLRHGRRSSGRLAETMPPRRDEWRALVDHHRMRAPRELDAFVGASWQYADILLGSLGRPPLPALLSTVKIRHAGFGDCIDTEDMLREWLTRFREHGLLPT